MNEIYLRIEYEYPDDIYYEILKFLNYKEVLPYCVVCRKWNSIIKSRLMFDINLKKKLRDESYLFEDKAMDNWMKCLKLQTSSNWIKSFNFDSQLLRSEKIVELCNFLRTSSNLTSLSALGCHLLDIPSIKAISSLTQLKSINLNECRLYQFDTIKSLSSLKSLTSLEIGRNNISDDDIKIFGESFPNLTHLGISTCRIGMLGVESICRLKLLLSLDLEKSTITTDGIKIITERLIGLEDLNISNTRSFRLEGRATEVCKAITQMKNLKRLAIAGNMIGNEGCSTLFSLQSLNHLNILGNNIDGGCFTEISNLSNLLSLKVEAKETFLYVENLECVFQLKSLTKLSFLHLVCCFEFFFKYSLPNLRQLSLPFCHVCDNFIERICKTYPHLEYLNCSWNSISDIGAKHISQLRDLTELNLRNNKLSYQAVYFLKDLPKLTSLNISFNDIGYDGGKCICDSFDKLITLRIEAIGNFEITNSLKQKRGLQTLEIDIFNRSVQGSGDSGYYQSYEQQQQQRSCCSLL